MPKGNIQKQRIIKKLLIVLAVILVLNISLLSCKNFKWNFDNSQNSCQVKLSYESSLAFGEYVYRYSSADKNEKINWEFSGSNHYVGIIVYAMTDSEFSKFQNLQTFYAYTLSNGDYYADSGTFYPQSYDVWYIMFLNIDTDMQTTYLTYNVEFYRGNITLFLQIFIPILVFIIVVGLIVGIVKYSKKQKEKKKLEIINKADTSVKYTETLPSQIESAVKFCPRCGTPQKLNAVYCVKCGNKFD